MEQFQYDQVGNWQNNGRVHNELNQLLEDDSCWYNYDADGNMTGKVSKQTGDTTYFVWDVENKLVEVRKPGMIARYAFDALGRRMRKTVNGQATEYRYNGQDLIIEINNDDDILASYTHGPGIDNPLLMNRNGNSYYYVKDGLGSVTAITDESCNVLQEYKYSVFGEIAEQTADSIENSFTYTAREFDEETGNYFYRARYYDPVVGRFLIEDPLHFASGDVNFLRYVFNNPVVFIDPFGLQCGPGNGLLEWLVPDEPLGYDFSDPCKQHDIDYGTPGKSKGECDQEFHENMQKQCNGDPLCEIVADIYYEAVNQFGDQAYHNAQSGGKPHIIQNEPFFPDVTYTFGGVKITMKK